MYTLQVSNCAHRAVAIRFGVIRFLVRMYATARGVWGHAPENFWGFRGYAIASGRDHFGPMRHLSKVRQQNFTCMNIFHSTHCVIQHWFHLSDCSQISISILVFQLANVTGITYKSHWCYFTISVRRKKCCIALFPHRRIWEVLEGQGDSLVLCSFNPVSTTKSCMRTAVDALTWSIWFMYNVLSSESWGVSNWSSVTNWNTLASLFFIPIYSSISTSKWSKLQIVLNRYR